MHPDLRRYLTDENYRRQVIQEDIARWQEKERLRRAEAASGSKAGMEERQRERTLADDRGNDREDMELRRRRRALDRGGLEL